MRKMKVVSALFGIGIAVSGVLFPQATNAFSNRQYEAAMVNCEDFDIQPCYTYDEGSWTIVSSYKPYKALRVRVCAKKPVAPCIGGKHDSQTRRVFFKSL